MVGLTCFWNSYSDRLANSQTSTPRARNPATANKQGRSTRILRSAHGHSRSSRSCIATVRPGGQPGAASHPRAAASIRRRYPSPIQIRSFKVFAMAFSFHHRSRPTPQTPHRSMTDLRESIPNPKAHRTTGFREALATDAEALICQPRTLDSASSNRSTSRRFMTQTCETMLVAVSSDNPATPLLAEQPTCG